MIPNGPTIDARKGVVEITRLERRRGQVLRRHLQGEPGRRDHDADADRELAGCPKAKRAARPREAEDAQAVGRRQGQVPDRGQYSAATVRGTKWLVQDRLPLHADAGHAGLVTVRDEVKKRTIVLRKGKSYTARPRR